MSLPLPIAGQPGRKSDMPLPGPPLKKRRRPPLACFQCRKRKVKCNQQRPCNNCTKARIPDCTFPAAEIPGHLAFVSAPRTPGPGSASSAQHDCSLSRDMPLVQGQEHHQNRSPPPSESVVNDRLVSSTPVSDLDATDQSRHVSQSPQSDVLFQRIKELEATVKKLSSSGHPPQDSLYGQKPSASAGDESQGPRFGNQSTWINGTSLFSNVLQPLGQAQAFQSQLRDSITNFHAVGELVDQHLAATTPVTTGTRVPERILADEFVECYLNYFEGWLRVLHVPTFRSEYERFWQKRDAVNQVFVLQLQMCMALGITSHRDCMHWRNAASQWLLEGRRWLQNSFEKVKNKPTFEELQLACLVLIAEANVSENDQMHQCWVSVGQLVRRAMRLNLHREPRDLPRMSVLQTEMRRRLWVTVLELNLLLSLQAGQPTLVPALGYDISPPSNLSDEELSAHPNEADPPEGPSSEAMKRAGITPQSALFDSFKLRSELVDKLSGIGPNMSYDEVLWFHAGLSKAKGRMQQSFRTNYPATTTASSAQNVIANIILSRYILALHLPVLGRSIRNPNYHFSRRLCITISIEIFKLSGIVDRNQNGGLPGSETAASSLKRLFVNSPGLFRHIAIQAIFATALELVTSKEEEFENSSVFPVWDVEELVQCLKAAESWSAERLQAGITDHRGYCFLGACIAYAHALDSGVPPEELRKVVVEAASKNAENCSNLMRGVAEKLGIFLTQGGAPTRGESFSALLPDVTDVTIDLTSSFFGVGMDGFAFDWTYPLDLGLEPTGGTNFGPRPL